MVQQMDQGGSMSWKRYLSSVGSYQQREYLYAESDNALLHSIIDPSLVHVAQQISEQYYCLLGRISEVDMIVYEQQDLPSRFVSTERHVEVSAEFLADRFGIGPKRAQRTLRVTTQRGVRSAIPPISRRYRTDRVFGVKRLNGKFTMDTAYGGNIKHRNTCTASAVSWSRTQFQRSMGSMPGTR
jgi:hypothetical protein